MVTYKKLKYGGNDVVQVRSAQKDANGAQIDTTYAKKTEIKDGILTINTNDGTTLGTFSANQSTNQTITLPNGSVQLLNQSVTFMSDNTYEEFPYRATVSVTDVTSSSYAEVTYSEEQATSLNFATFCDTGTGVIHLYSRTNVGTVTIPTISIGMNYSNITIDSTPTSGSSNPVSSGGVYSALEDYVTLGTTQTITGTKTFDETIIGSITGSAGSVPWSGITSKPGLFTVLGDLGDNYTMNKNDFNQSYPVRRKVNTFATNALSPDGSNTGDYYLYSLGHTDANGYTTILAVTPRLGGGSSWTSLYIGHFWNGTWEGWHKLALTTDNVASASSVPWAGVSGRPGEDNTQSIGSLMNLTNWTPSTNYVTRNTIAHWDGSYQSSGNYSNIQYGKFGRLLCTAIGSGTNGGLYAEDVNGSSLSNVGTNRYGTKGFIRVYDGNSKILIQWTCDLNGNSTSEDRTVVFPVSFSDTRYAVVMSNTRTSDEYSSRQGYTPQILYKQNDRVRVYTGMGTWQNCGLYVIAIGRYS